MIDIWVKRGFELGSDHYLLKLDKIWKENSGEDMTRRRKWEKGKSVIKSYRLKEEEIGNTYREHIERRVRGQSYLWNSEEVETSWQIIKKILLEAAELACGMRKVGSREKKTAWWTEEIKEVVKEKKVLWKEYLKNSTEENYERYTRVV